MKENKQNMTIENCPDILSTKQVAEILNVSERTVNYLISGYELESFKIGKLRRITKVGLFRYLYELTSDEFFNPAKLEKKQEAFYLAKKESFNEATL